MPAKLLRQNRIKKILNDRMISSQEQLVKLLRNDGIKVTQATLSRDFAELGVVRTFSELGIRYVLNAEESGRQISKLIGFEIISVEYNESLVVIRTLAGRAQGVAHYIDRLNREDILGTIAGDDTVLVIPSSVQKVAQVVAFIRDMMIRIPDKKYYGARHGT